MMTRIRILADGSRAVTTALLMLLLLAAAAPLAADRLEVVDVHNRPASELVDTLRAAARGNVSITAEGQRLIFRGPTAEVERLTELVDRLDTPAEQLRISVRTQQGGQTVQRGAELPGSEGSRGDVRVYGSRSSGDRDSVQEVLVRNGHPAHITIGRQVMESDETIILGRGTVGYSRQTRMRDLDRGFYALPHVQGENVTLELAARREHLRSDGNVDRAELVTAVSGRLGEWLLVGRTASSDRGTEHGTRYRTRRSANEDTSWWVRVERP
ncbi:MAG: hypothetical protein JJU06_16395 [Ectothiorhodospiraceae bacterium]|nr:hypothetical protein [Ectothiorhodospiraceae bacterium]MCH8503029.1 hypothetical protein [Ectothiorhodospiraceae bacterium]